jgi:hypothetical protein
LHLSRFTVTLIPPRFATQLWSIWQRISYCKLVFSFPLHLPHFPLTHTHKSTSKFSGEFDTDIHKKKKNPQRRFSVLVENAAISPAMIDSLTRAGVSSLQFQNQTVNDITAGNTILSVLLSPVQGYRTWTTQDYCMHFAYSSYTGLQVFIVLFCNLSPPPPHMAQQPLVGQGLLVIEASGSHSQSFRHTTLWKTPLDDWSSRRRDLHLTTHNTHKIQISYNSDGIRTHNPRKWAPSYPHLRPRGHLARPSVFPSFSKCMSASTTWCLVMAAWTETWTTTLSTDISTVVFCWFHHEISYD